MDTLGTASVEPNTIKDDMSKLQNGIVQVKDANGADSNAYGIYFKGFVDAIITEYNKLIS